MVCNQFNFDNIRGLASLKFRWDKTWQEGGNWKNVIFDQNSTNYGSHHSENKFSDRKEKNG
jgi:hypothetical protein